MVTNSDAPPPAATAACRRLRLAVEGAVQGVGFRPFVYRLAEELGLAGWVANDPRGVRIEVQGEEAALARFRERLEPERPPLAAIHRVEATWLAPERSNGSGRFRGARSGELGEADDAGDPGSRAVFEIRGSAAAGERTAVVLPDAATCPACLAEVLDPADRRHRYPFTNCTHCGPRFTIVRALPYDRPNTTMAGFEMCPDCRREYRDPRDRRFHAQPNACPACGPRLALWMPDGTPVPGDPLVVAAEAVRRGEVVALKGLGGFQLLVDARSEGAVARLRRRKLREEKPFAVMVRDLDAARALCRVPPAAAAALSSVQAPILLLERLEAPSAGAAVAPGLAPGNPYLGVMLPTTPLHHLLLRELGFPVVATSGNRSDEPIVTDEEEALERLGGIAVLFLVHDRPVERHADDSVVRLLQGEPRLLRRARGYAPMPVVLPRPVPAILAVGAHLKNTVALSVGEKVYLSQHLGDMETPEAVAAFERVIDDFLRLYEAGPVAVAHDLHPDYATTRHARELALRLRRRHGGEPVPLLGVQHHHAHFASCLADAGEAGPALGVTWDGTGYGADGTIWGGELLLGDAAACRRVGRLRPFRLPGGDAAVREPRRVAVALLWEILGPAALERDDLAPVAAVGPGERRLLGRMLETGWNAPVTTSAGRLFDGVAALLDLRQTVSFEGQAAMALEHLADSGEAGGAEGGGAYPVALAGGAVDGLELDWRPLLEAVLADLARGVRRDRIARRFHRGLADGIAAAAAAVGEERVALTGGCFQNRRLTEAAARRLERAGHRVLLHRAVPPNDGGIALGQVMVAAARLERGLDQGLDQTLATTIDTTTEEEAPCAWASPDR